jgi:hypothetical protein
MDAPSDATKATRAGASGQDVDWAAWHDSYDRAETPLARRLAVVQAQVAAALDRAPDGPLRAISICAGQGHDLIGVLARHPRAKDVAARLVELDGGNVAQARQAVVAAGLDGVEVLEADAALGDSYAGAVPADVVLLCGVLGNISAEDVDRTIESLPQLCARGATVIWTRHRNPPDLVPHILERLAGVGFEAIALEHAPHLAVGAARLRSEPGALRPGLRMFDFIGHRALWPHLDADARAKLAALFDPAAGPVVLVEAIRALPPGGQPGQTVEQMLREGRATNAARHLLLAQLLARVPDGEPAIVHRVHRLEPAIAAELYGPRVAAAVPADGMTDVHRYITVTLAGARLAVDASAPEPRWDGRSDLGPFCGPGRDVPVGADPDADLEALELEHCDPTARASFVAALAATGVPDTA